MPLVKLLYGVMTASSVKGQEQIVAFPLVFLFDPDAVAECFQDPRPAQRRYPIAVARSRRRGGDDSDSHQAGATKLIKSERTGAKASPDVASVGRVEVPIIIVDQPRACHPATAAQHCVIAEPR